MDIYYLILVLPAILLSLWASSRVNSTFKKFAKIHNRRGLTGADAARRVLDANGDEIELRDEDEDEVVYVGNNGPFADEDLDMGLGSEKDVDLDEAADAGFEIQDEDDVFGDFIVDDSEL